MNKFFIKIKNIYKIDSKSIALFIIISPLASMLFIATYYTYIHLYLMLQDSYFKKAIPCNLNNHSYKTKEINKNSGCLMYQDGKVVFIKEANNLASKISGGANKFSLPGGTANKNENSVCTAYRETFEESGIDTKIIKKLKVYKDKNFHLYLCKPLKKITKKSLLYKRKFEIEKVVLANIDEIEIEKSRFLDQALFAFQWVKNNELYLNSKEYKNA